MPSDSTPAPKVFNTDLGHQDLRSPPTSPEFSPLATNEPECWVPPNQEDSKSLLFSQAPEVTSSSSTPCIDPHHLPLGNHLHKVSPFPSTLPLSRHGYFSDASNFQHFVFCASSWYELSPGQVMSPGTTAALECAFELADYLGAYDLTTGILTVGPGRPLGDPGGSTAL